MHFQLMSGFLQKPDKANGMIRICHAFRPLLRASNTDFYPDNRWYGGDGAIAGLPASAMPTSEASRQYLKQE